jgi:cyclopropane fatty-acyl-phospholipid synthase-like methyltransferase
MRSSADDKALYDESYYRANLHAAHWFLNNAKKTHLRNAAVLSMLKPNLTMRVLDIGSAGGANALLVAGKVASVLGLDYSDQAVAASQQLAREHAADNVKFVVDDATQLKKVGDGLFDAATAIDFVEHVNDEELARMLNALQSKLRNGGYLCIYTPCASHYVEKLRKYGFIKQLRGHIAVRTFEQLRDLLQQQGWQVRENFFLPSTYPLFGIIDRLMQNIPLLGRLFYFRICIVATVRNKA